MFSRRSNWNRGDLENGVRVRWRRRVRGCQGAPLDGDGDIHHGIVDANEIFLRAQYLIWTGIVET